MENITQDENIITQEDFEFLKEIFEFETEIYIFDVENMNTLAERYYFIGKVSYNELIQSLNNPNSYLIKIMKNNTSKIHFFTYQYLSDELKKIVDVVIENVKFINI